MQELDDLEQSVHSLLTRYQQLQAEMSALRAEHEQQRVELLRTHGELYDLQLKHRALLTAHHMLGGDEDRQRAKQQLSLIIAQVDRAMEALKS